MRRQTVSFFCSFHIHNKKKTEIELVQISKNIAQNAGFWIKIFKIFMGHLHGPRDKEYQNFGGAS
jgi:hypothetical protein